MTVTARIATENESSNRTRQMASICTARHFVCPPEGNLIASVIFAKLRSRAINTQTDRQTDRQSTPVAKKARV